MKRSWPTRSAVCCVKGVCSSPNRPGREHASSSNACPCPRAPCRTMTSTSSSRSSNSSAPACRSNDPASVSPPPCSPTSACLRGTSAMCRGVSPISRFKRHRDGCRFACTAARSGSAPSASGSERNVQKVAETCGTKRIVGSAFVALARWSAARSLRRGVGDAKWGGHPHYRYAAHFLGEDEHGKWMWGPAGRTIYRGGQPLFVAEQDTLVLLVAAAGGPPRGG